MIVPPPVRVTALLSVKNGVVNRGIELNRAGVVDGADQNGAGVILREIIAKQGERPLRGAIQDRRVIHRVYECPAAGIVYRAALDVGTVDQLHRGVRADGHDVGVFIDNRYRQLQNAAAGSFKQTEVGDVVVNAQRNSGDVGVDYAGRLVSDAQTVVADLPRAFESGC